MIRKNRVVVFLIAEIFIAIFVTWSAAEEAKTLHVTQSVILEASAGNNIGEIGIHDHNNSSEAGESINPICIYRGTSILVGDSINQRVQEFDMSGKVLRIFSIPSTISYIQAITTDSEGNIYVLTGPPRVQVWVFSHKRKTHSVIDLSGVGQLEKQHGGKIKLNKSTVLNGTVNKVLIDRNRNIYVSGADLLMLNTAGKILHRWGPDVRNFIIDRDGKVIIRYDNKIEIYDSNHKLIKRFSLFNSRGQFVVSEWGPIVWPEYIDDNNNVYGFLAHKEYNLAKYSKRNRQVEVYPVSRDDFINSSWTVDQLGNIYREDAAVRFSVIKISVLK